MLPHNDQGCPNFDQCLPDLAQIGQMLGNSVYCLANVCPHCTIWDSVWSIWNKVDPNLASFDQDWSNLGRTSALGTAFRQLVRNNFAAPAAVAALAGGNQPERVASNLFRNFRVICFSLPFWASPETPSSQGFRPKSKRSFCPTQLSGYRFDSLPKSKRKCCPIQQMCGATKGGEQT